MGADRPERKNSGTIIQIPFPLLPFGAALLLLLVALFQIFDFPGADETPALSPQDEARLQKRLKEIDEAEQYALIAIESGWYPCNHPGRTAFYLLPGEVWKYGTTTKGQFGRYSIKYLAGINVSYLLQFRGTISECLKEEQLKLFYYPYLPENLARPPADRLRRPPYNSKMQ